MDAAISTSLTPILGLDVCASTSTSTLWDGRASMAKALASASEVS